MFNIILKEINNGNKKKIDGWWVDKNGNKWLGLLYTQEEALMEEARKSYSKFISNIKHEINYEAYPQMKGGE